MCYPGASKPFVVAGPKLAFGGPRTAALFGGDQPPFADYSANVPIMKVSRQQPFRRRCQITVLNASIGTARGISDTKPDWIGSVSPFGGQFLPIWGSTQGTFSITINEFVSSGLETSDSNE